MAKTVGTAAPIAWAKNPGMPRRPRAVSVRKMTAALTMLVRTTTHPPPASSDVPAPIAPVATVVTQRRYGWGAWMTASKRSRASCTDIGSAATWSTTSCRRERRVKSWFRARTHASHGERVGVGSAVVRHRERAERHVDVHGPQP